MRTRLLPVFVVLLGLLAIGASAGLAQRSSTSRDAELSLAQVKIDLSELQGAPIRGDTTAGGKAEVARRLIDATRARIDTRLTALRGQSPPAALRPASAAVRANYAVIERIYILEQHPEVHPDPAVVRSLLTSSGRAASKLDVAAHSYHRTATRSQTEATVGSALAIALLLAAFAFFYRRSTRARARAERLAEENQRLLGHSQVEALTDALTGLRNRRSLGNDLVRELADGSGDGLLLALFDLDGFKQYNDTFGHPAGDALLNRLGERLTAATSGLGTAYRMGGDEFCLLARAAPDAGEKLAGLAADALSEVGDSFAIGCSFGMVRLPVEAATAEEAILLADQRMYENKAGRSSASRQSTDVLLKVLSERAPELGAHLDSVAALAEATAEHLALPDAEVRRVRLAAELHDVGKTAIPDSILDKPGGLDDEEWAFMRRHTVIGERIVLAASSLAHTASLVRSSHERFDGQGYPDGLRGDAIPLGASIISVCDAFDAMIGDRPYRVAVSVAAARLELERCSGTQFDPRVVDAFLAVAAEFESIGGVATA